MTLTSLYTVDEYYFYTVAKTTLLAGWAYGVTTNHNDIVDIPRVSKKNRKLELQ